MTDKAAASSCVDSDASDADMDDYDDGCMSDADSG